MTSAHIPGAQSLGRTSPRERRASAASDAALARSVQPRHRELQVPAPVEALRTSWRRHDRGELQRKRWFSAFDHDHQRYRVSLRTRARSRPQEAPVPRSESGRCACWPHRAFCVLRDRARSCARSSVMMTACWCRHGRSPRRIRASRLPLTRLVPKLMISTVAHLWMSTPRSIAAPPGSRVAWCMLCCTGGTTMTGALQLAAYRLRKEAA